MNRTEAWLSEYERKRGSEPTGLTTPQTLVCLSLPFPPSVNHVGADGLRKGRKTGSYKAFMWEVAKRTRDAGSPRVDGRLSLHVDVTPPDKRRRDLDNMLKCICDSLQKAGVYKDDCLIDDLRIMRLPAGEGGIVVTVTQICSS